MKRPIIKIAVLFFVASFVLITACDNSKKNLESTNGLQSSETDIQKQQNGLDKKEEKLNLDDYNLDYVFATDNQPETAYNMIAKGENGFYFIRGSEKIGENTYLPAKIMYFDKKSKGYVPLCNKAGCEHSDENCNACLVDTEDVQYMPFYLKYNDGYIYTIAVTSVGECILVKISEDGSTREDSNILLKANITSVDDDKDNWMLSPEFAIHRGYVYFSDGTPYSNKIFRSKLGSNEVQAVYENTGDGADVYRIKVYGDYLFFQSVNFLDKNYTEYDAGLFAMNIHTGELTLIKKNVVRYYIIKEDILYYVYGNDIHSYDLKSMEDKTIIKDFSDDIFTLFVEDDKLYVTADKMDKIYTYNLNGELINTFSFSEIGIDVANQIVVTNGYCILEDEYYYYKKIDDEESDWVKLIY